MASPIEDYALLGDCRSAALVSREGSVDWLCLPRFDSGALFAALLGDDRHGRWRIAPAEEHYRVHRRYLGDSMVLETTFETTTGVCRLLDGMLLDRPDAVRAMLRKHKQLWCDLAYRTDQASGGKVDAAWREAFTEFPDRFMVGTDTFTPERWHYVGEHARWSREWLADLPREVAERIAYKNGEALFPRER